MGVRGYLMFAELLNPLNLRWENFGFRTNLSAFHSGNAQCFNEGALSDSTFRHKGGSLLKLRLFCTSDHFLWIWSPIGDKPSSQVAESFVTHARNNILTGLKWLA
jgi:hypothetical protein